jgi:hypothetical protein
MKQVDDIMTAIHDLLNENATAKKLTGQTVLWLDYYWKLRTIYNQPVTTQDGVKGVWGTVPVVKVDGVWYEDFT